MSDPSFEETRPLVHVPTRDPQPCRQNHLSKKRKLARRDEDNEVVSLGSSQEEMIEEALMNPEVKMEDPQTANEAGLFGRYAPNKDSDQKADLTPTVTKVVEYIVAPSNQNCCCTSCENPKDKTMWMLDSGASFHFTNNLNDYIEYEAIAPVEIQTATTVTHIVGRGTVNLTVDGVAIRISPVHYIPDLSPRLLSLG